MRDAELLSRLQKYRKDSLELLAEGPGKDSLESRQAFKTRGIERVAHVEALVETIGEKLTALAPELTPEQKRLRRFFSILIGKG